MNVCLSILEVFDISYVIDISDLFFSFIFSVAGGIIAYFQYKQDKKAAEEEKNREVSKAEVLVEISRDLGSMAASIHDLNEKIGKMNAELLVLKDNRSPVHLSEIIKNNNELLVAFFDLHEQIDGIFMKKVLNNSQYFSNLQSAITYDIMKDLPIAYQRIEESGDAVVQSTETFNNNLEYFKNSEVSHEEKTERYYECHRHTVNAVKKVQECIVAYRGIYDKLQILKATLCGES